MSAQPAAKGALAEIFNAEDKDHARKAAKAFEADYGAKWPKATAKITEHLHVLLVFYDYPVEHWIHLRTRTRSSRPSPPWGSARGSPKPLAPAGVAMAFKLIDSVQTRWRAVNAHHLVALVRAGARFHKGVLVERPDESGDGQQAA